MNTAVSPESGTIPEKKNILEKNILSLRLDQAIGLVLVLMVFYVVVFSMGFEKGKRSIHNSQVLKSSAPVAPVSEPLPRNLLLYEDTALPSAGEKALVATVPQQIPIPAVVSDKSSNQESDTESSRPAGKYTIQHVIYTTRSAAEREVLRLTQKGERAFIVPSGKYIQVCLAGFTTKKEADQYLKQLRTQKVIAADAYVRNMPA